MAKKKEKFMKGKKMKAKMRKLPESIPTKGSYAKNRADMALEGMGKMMK